MPRRRTTPPSCHSGGAAKGADERFCAECGVAAVEPATVSADLTEHLTEQDQTLMLMLTGPEASGLQMPPGSPPESPAEDPGLPKGATRLLRRSLVVKTLAVLTVLTVLAAVGVLALNDQGTHQRLTRSSQALKASQAQLKATRVKLADTVTQLTGVKTDLASTQTTLTTTKKALAAKEQDLRGVQNNLSDVKSSLTIKSGQVETLKSCLNGVSIALRDYANGDYAGTVSALGAVQVSCNSAYALL